MKESKSFISILTLIILLIGISFSCKEIKNKVIANILIGNPKQDIDTNTLSSDGFVLCPPEGYKPGQKIAGINLEAPPNPFKKEAFDPILAINADHISVIPYAFLNSSSGKVIFNTERQWWGESAAGTIATINMANEKGLSVMLKPHVWVGGQGWAGELKLEGEALETWKKEYEAYILFYAKIAAANPVGIYCIGTEFRHLSQEKEYWIQLISKVRKIFRGRLVYAANWDNYQKIEFWNKLDFIGIDAYFPLVKKNEAINLKNLNHGINELKQELSSFSNAQRRHVLFTEFGFQSVKGAVKGHWDADKSHRDEKEQANCLSAFMQSFENEKWFDGGFLWKWHISTNILDNHQDPFSPQGKIAIDTLTNRFAAWQE